MDSLVKSAHSLHQFIVIACLTTIALWLPARKGPDYDAVIAELDVLIELNERKKDDMQKRVNEAVDKRTLGFYLSDAILRPGYVPVRPVVENQAQENARLARAGEKNDQLLADTMGMELEAVKKLKPSTYLQSSSPCAMISLDEKISDVLKSLDAKGERGVCVVAPDPEELTDALRAYRVKTGSVPEWSVSAWDSLTISTSFDEIWGRENATMMISHSGRRPEPDGLLFDLVQIPCTTREFDDFTFRKWAESVTNGKSEILRSPQRGWLPELRSFWSEVAEKTPYESARIMQEKAEQNRNQHSFFGVTVSGNALVFTASGLIIALSLALIAHLSQIRLWIKSGRVIDLKESWIALFDDLFSRILTIASFTVLPMAGLGLALHWTWGSMNFWTRMSSAVLSCLAILCCCLCAYMIDDPLRKKLNALPMVVEKKTA